MNTYFRLKLTAPAIIPNNTCPKICSRLGLLTISGLPIIDESSVKVNPVREKPKDKIEKITHDFIKNFICPDNFTRKNIFWLFLIFTIG